MRTTALFIAANVLLVGSAATAQTAPEAIASAKALVSRYASLKNNHDATKMSTLYSENYIEHSGRNPSGLAAVTDNWKSQFAAIPDVQINVDDIIVSGDKVVARITYTGTHTTPFFAGISPTGRRFSFGTIDIWRIESDRFAEHWDQVDFAGLQRQLTAKATAP
jgi:predicted ester cyclase